MTSETNTTVAKTGSAKLKKRLGGRPTSSEAEDIDRRILAAALALFLKQGFANTSMDAVASEASVSKGTLYSRYNSKSDLFRATAADRMRSWSKILPGPDARAGDLQSRLLKRAHNILKGISMPEVRAFERVIASEAGRFPEFSQEFYEHGFRLIVEHVGADLRNAVGTRETSIEPEFAAKVFVAGLLGWYRAEGLTRDVKDKELKTFASKMVIHCLSSLGLNK